MIAPAKVLILFAAIFLVLLPCQGSNAQSVSVGAIAQYVFDDIKSRIQRSGRNDLNNAIDGVVFEIDIKTPIPNATAQRRPNGTRRLTITAQFVLLMMYFAELQILGAEDASLNDCGLSFSHYIRTEYPNLLASVSAGKPTSPLLPPDEYASRAPACSALTKRYPMSDALKAKRNGMVMNALAFIIMHELGHFHYRHVPGQISEGDLSVPANMRGFLISMCYEQEKEKQADEFAASALVDLGLANVVLDQTVWMALVALGSIDPDLNRGSTHPGALRRMQDAMVVVRGRLAAKGTPMSKEVSDLVDAVIAMQKKIDRELQLYIYPGSEGVRCN